MPAEVWAVVGLAAEARLLAGHFAGRIAVGGGTAAGARAAVARAVAGGATGLLSFGVAGGLDPELRPGALVVPRFVRVGDESYAADVGLVAGLGGVTQQVSLGGSEIVGSATGKRALWQRTGAAAVDLESAAVAGSGLPFAALRAVCDPAERDLPPAAMVPLRGGQIAFGGILLSLALRPRQVAGLVGLGRDAARAKAALMQKVRGIRPGAFT